MADTPSLLGGDGTHSRVELKLSFANVPNLDTFSKSDPMAVVFIEEQGQQVEWGRTECIQDSLNPKFVKSIVLDYFFEEVQNVTVKLFDVDDPSGPLSRQEFIGAFTFQLANLMCAPGCRMSSRLSGPQAGNSTVTVSGEEVVEMNYTISFQFCARKLDKKDWGWNQSDPFMVFSKCREDGQWVPVLQTEVIMCNLSPTWRPFTVPAGRLCNGDFDRPLLVEVYDWNRSGTHELIGKFETSVRGLIDHGGRDFPVIHPTKQKKRGYTHSGTVHVLQALLTKENSFLDYISGGCEVSLMVAIDFTASNGKPEYANSLHYSNPYQPNQYRQAIQSIGQILTCYDSDNMYPVYGFGAKLPPHGAVSHCFACNGNEQAAEVHGVNGILDAYEAALRNVTLFGPTLFGQIIQTASDFAASGANGSKWTILLLLTDGVVNDLAKTKDAIVAASNLPMSIVIVGVGEADFTAMNELDGDDAALVDSDGRPATRDIVQFVAFQEHKNSPGRLAKEVLAEVPHQLLQYMKAHKIAPSPRRQAVEAPPYTPPPYEAPTGPSEVPSGLQVGGPAGPSVVPKGLQVGGPAGPPPPSY